MFWIEIIVICAFYEYEVSSSYLGLYTVFSCVLYYIYLAPRAILSSQLSFLSSLVNLLLVSSGNKSVQHISKITCNLTYSTVIFERSLFSYTQNEKKKYSRFGINNEDNQYHASFLFFHSSLSRAV